MDRRLDRIGLAKGGTMQVHRLPKIYNIGLQLSGYGYWYFNVVSIWSISFYPSLWHLTITMRVLGGHETGGRGLEQNWGPMHTGPRLKPPLITLQKRLKYSDGSNVMTLPWMVRIAVRSLTKISRKNTTSTAYMVSTTSWPMNVRKYPKHQRHDGVANDA